MPSTIAMRFRFSKFLSEDATARDSVANVLARPCFGALETVAAKKLDKFVQRKKATADTVSSYLADRAYEGVFLESRGRDMTASAEVPNGEHARTWPPSPTRLYAYVAVPVVAEAREEVISAACDLARALDAQAGAITVEPDHRLAQRWGLDSPRPTARPGLSERRMRERRAHRRYESDLATKVGGPEWGLFLGEGHLAQLDLKALRAAAAKVTELGPSLLFVQATDDPFDELTDGFDARLDPLRAALVPVLMDTSAIE